MKRRAFGQLLSENPLHMQTLARLEVNLYYVLEENHIHRGPGVSSAYKNNKQIIKGLIVTL